MMLFPFEWSVNKWLLIACNIFAGSVLIVLEFTNVFPLDPVSFIFFSVLGFFCALYRPGWVFLLLIGMVPYEYISIAPAGVPVDIRPYQWLLALVVLALVVRRFFGRSVVETMMFTLWDKALFVFGISALGSALISGDLSALKLSVILCSFLVLYGCCRLFVRSADDVLMLVPFLLSSFVVVVCYAIVQNIFFLNGWENRAVMLGRPNATFSEADWLGGYLAVIIVSMTALIAFSTKAKDFVAEKQARVFLSSLLFLGYVALIISVSRSAWLATGIGVAVVLMLFGWQQHFFRACRERNGQVLREIVRMKVFLLAPCIVALGVVAGTALTPFDVLDRGKSIVSGEQKITVVCDRVVSLPEKISSVEVLSEYGCAHIRLEEKDVQSAAGRYVTDVFRDDPNVSLRQDIYKKSMYLLNEHWLTGIGFGVVAKHLGTDARGAGLNASNIFLDVWLGSGFVGIIAFCVFWFGLGWHWLYNGVRHHIGIAYIFGSVWMTITVFNFFNAGLFLAWFFVFCAFLVFVPVIDETKNDQHLL